MAITVHPEAKALIFDLDGTLSNSLPVHVETWRIVGEKYGFDFDPNIIFEMTGRPTIEFAKRIIEQYKVNEQPEILVRMKQQAFWDAAHLLEPVQEVISIVKTYHDKLPMSVGTGASSRSAEVQLKALGLRDYFDFVVSADDVEKHKPHPETFVKCAELMGVEPQFCQVFEDGDLGISAAKEAGMFITDVREHITYGEWALPVNK
ncbi:MAG: beta-phosphoglucomutase family hydrolase [Draconibacterium sp.]